MPVTLKVTGTFTFLRINSPLAADRLAETYIAPLLFAPVGPAVLLAEFFQILLAAVGDIFRPAVIGVLAEFIFTA
ncbi:MAG: hypothetical protein ACK2U3_05510, partial [Anaerolineales bacterium]